MGFLENITYLSREYYYKHYFHIYSLIICIDLCIYICITRFENLSSILFLQGEKLKGLRPARAIPVRVFFLLPKDRMYR